jgi:hypothetical protein
VPRPAKEPMTRTLIDRLGVRAGMRVAVVGNGAPGLVTAVRERAGSVSEISLVTDPSLAGRGLLAAGLAAGLTDTNEVRVSDRLTGVRFVPEQRQKARAPRDRGQRG